MRVRGRVIRLLLLLTLGLESSAWAYKFATGSYTGNITDDRPIDISDTSIFEDFLPEFVAIKCDATQYGRFNTTGTDSSFWFTVNNQGQTNAIQSFTANGFVIGSHNDVNASGVTCWYIALAKEVGQNDFAVGTYTGSGVGTDDRTIDISDTSDANDFQPGLVIVKSQDTTGFSVWRSSAMASDLSCTFPGTACVANQIQSFVANGFVVGTHANVNTDLITYRYMALKDTTSSAAGSYTGTGLDDKPITVGFQPQFVFVKGASTTVGRQRFLDMVGDDSIGFHNVASATNNIKSFTATGFTVGTDSAVNTDTVTYYWYAIRVFVAATRQRLRMIW